MALFLAHRVYRVIQHSVAFQLRISSTPYSPGTDLQHDLP